VAVFTATATAAAAGDDCPPWPLEDATGDHHFHRYTKERRRQRTGVDALLLLLQLLVLEERFCI